MQYQNDQIFQDIDSSKEPILKGEYEYCIFKNCNFLESDLTEFKFIDCEFFDCNLSNAKILKTSFQQTKFSNCKMMGLQFDTCHDFNFAIQFNLCNLNHSNFYQMNLQKTSFIECRLENAEFTEANLTAISMQKCDLLNAVFEHTNLEKTDFRNAINYTIDLEVNRVSGAKFSSPEVIRLLDKYKLEIQFT